MFAPRRPTIWESGCHVRIALSVLIAVGLLAIPFVYVSVLPDPYAPYAAQGIWVDPPPSTVAGLGWLLLPGQILAAVVLLIGLVLGLPDMLGSTAVFMAVFFASNIAVYAALVWFLLRWRERRAAISSALLASDLPRRD